MGLPALPKNVMADQAIMDEEGLYPSEEETMSSENEGKEEAPESIDAEEAEGDTAVIDNKIISPSGEDPKEGEEIVFVVVKNYGGESEIRRKTSKQGGSVKTPSMMDEAMTELDAMDQG